MYDYKCKECSGVTARFRKIDERNDLFPCSCGGLMQLVILKAPAAKVQGECHYICPATGQEITSWRQRRSELARHDLVPVDPDKNNEVLKRRMERKKERDKIASTYLPTDLRKQLTKMGESGEKPLDRFAT